MQLRQVTLDDGVTVVVRACVDKLLDLDRLQPDLFFLVFEYQLELVDALILVEHMLVEYFLLHFQQFLILATTFRQHASFFLQSDDALVIQLIHLAEFEVADGGLRLNAHLLLFGAVFAQLLLRVDESSLLVDLLPLELANGMRQIDVLLLENAYLIGQLLHSQAQTVAF